ncbi:MAG: Chemotaxis sensor histidine kinase CheA [Pseudomonadota bacterium]|jgi:chemotaxis protein histidine kinase CheA
MDDPLDELWGLFGAEYDEYLTAIEAILASPDPTGRIDELFRAFHSIKGGSAALALRGIEKVSHAAEDVLHKVRNGQLALDRPVEQALFAALDELRALESSSLTARVDQPVNGDLVARLHALLPPDAKAAGAKAAGGKPGAAKAGAAAAGTAKAPPPPPPPPPPPAGERGADASMALVPAVPVEDGGEEPDLTLLQDPVLTLAGALDEDPREAAAFLAAMAAELGQDGLAASAGRLAGAEPGGPEHRLALLDLCDRMRALEMGTGVPLGAMALVGTAERTMAELLQELAAELKTEEETGLEGTAPAWRRALRALSVLDVAELAEVADLALSHLSAAPMLRHEAADLIALTGIFLETGVGAPREEIEALRASVYHELGLAIDVGFAETAAGPGEAATPGPAPGLSRESLDRAAAARDRGLSLYAVTLDLESDHARADPLLDLLAAGGIITSRSRLDQGAGWFEFVVTTPEPAAALAAALAEVDPDRVALHGLRRIATSGPAAERLEAEGPDLLDPAPGRPPPAPPAPEAAGPGGERTGAAKADTPKAPPVAGGGEARPGAPGPRVGDAAVRVSGTAIDGIMDRVGDLRLGATGLSLTVGRYQGARVRHRLERLLDAVPAHLRGELGGVAAALAELEHGLADGMSQMDGGIRRLYQSTTALRVVPIGSLFTRLLRPVRETATAVGKEVALTTSGDDVQVDKAVIEMLVDPLTHIVRNAIDHGIEAPETRTARGKPAGGSIHVRARQGVQTATIEVEDDGGGIAVERVKDKALSRGLITPAAAASMTAGEALELIFLPGFSTRDEVTETSGRGVGMDIVATVVRKKLGGTLRIDSRPGAGTRITIEFPISAAIQRVLSVRAGGQTLALLERAVAEIIQVPADRVQTVGDRRGTFLRGTFLPVTDLAGTVGQSTPPPPAQTQMPALASPGGEDGMVTIIVVDDGRRRVGFAVEALLGRQEVFFKRLHPLLERNRLLSGIAVIGAGSVLFALDAEALVDAAQSGLQPGHGSAPATNVLTAPPARSAAVPAGG